MAGHIIYVHDTVPAPPEVVWEVLTDVAHADRVLRSVKHSAPITEGAYGVSTRWRETRTVFGHHGQQELAVVEADPPSRTVVETRVGKDVVRTAYRLTAAGPQQDHTRLTMTTTLVDADRSPLGRIAWEMFGGLSYGHTRRMFEHDLEDIAAEVRKRAPAV